MNFNKGAKTKGRGTSFKGALTYYLHDKDTLETAHRVGFVEMLNLFTDDPHDAWREMMVTADAAPRAETPRRPLTWRKQERTSPSMPSRSNGTRTTGPPKTHARRPRMTC